MTEETISTKEAPTARPAAPSQPAPFSYKVVGREEIGKARWDKFAEESPTAWLYHCYDYADIWSTFPGRSDLSFGLIDPKTSELVAIIPLYKIKDRMARFVTWNSLDVFGGVALKPLVTGKIKTGLMEFLCNELRSMATKHEAHEIRFSLAPMTPEILGEQCPLVNPLLDWECHNTLGQTWVCDLRLGKDGLWKNIGKGARSSISKAQKLGVQIRPARESDLEPYYRLHLETFNRTGTTPMPKAFFAGIWEHFLKTGRSTIFVAELNGEVIAAANFAVYKTGVYYWTGASGGAALSSGANSLLQWVAMQWMVEQKLEWYEVGEALSKAESGKKKQISDFKKDFGGSLYPLFRGNIDVKTKFLKAMALVKEFRTQVLG